MDASVVGKPVHVQRGLQPVCSACGIIIDRQSLQGGTECSLCGRKFCTSCYKFKETLEESSTIKSGHMEFRDCVTCDRVVEIKQNPSLFGEGVLDVSQDDKHRQTYPTKPPRSLQNMNIFISQGKNKVERRGHHPRDNGLFESSKHDFAKSIPFAKSSPKQAEDKARINFGGSGHFRFKWNDRGLRSVSGIPDQDDNRNYLFFEHNKNISLYGNMQTWDKSDNPEQKGLRETFHSEMKQANVCGTGQYHWDDNFDEGIHNGKQDRVFPNIKHSESKEVFGKSQRSARNERDSLKQEMQDWGPEEYQHPENPQHDSEIPTVSLDNKSDEFPQTRQFYNETIHYPSADKAYSNSGKRQLTYSGNKSQDFYRHNPAGPDSGKIDHEREAHEHSYNGGNSNYSASWFADNGLYEDDAFEDMDDVPLYSEIPFALIITGNVDKNLLRKSKKKEEQRLALEMITRRSDKKSDNKAVKKNKNQNPASESRNTSATSATEGNAIKNASIFPLSSDAGPKKSNTLHNDNVGSFTSKSDNTEKDKYGGSTELKRENALGSQFENKESKHLRQAFTGSGRINDEKHDIVATDRKVTKLYSSFDNETSGTHGDLDSHCTNKGVSQNKGVTESANRLGAISYSERNVDKTSSEKFGKEMQINEEKKSKDSSDVEKSSKEEFDKRKSEREIIREKRLKNINTKQMNNVNISHEIPHAPDHREVTFSSDMTNKPVKSKAFRSKVPNFKCVQTTTSVEVRNKKENDKHKSNPSKLGLLQSTSSAEDKNQPVKINSSIEKDFTNGSKQNSNDSNVFKSNETGRNSSINERDGDTSKETNRNDAEGENEEEDDGIVPIAMKIIKRQQDQKKLFQGTFQEKDESSGLPFAMRLLQQAHKEEKGKKDKQKEDSQKKGTDSTVNSFFNLLTALGATSASIPKKSSPKITELDNSTSEKKQPKKNKNKNIAPAVQNVKKGSFAEGSEADDKRKESVIIFGGTRQQPENGDSKSHENSTDAYKLKPLVIINFAENRHKAFQKIKMSQSEERLKCTACGRQECQGHHMKKMKEIVRIANQAGFEVRDVSPDGNCMFAAVVDQLQLYGDHSYGPKSLREAAVSWLIEHPHSDDGTPLSSFLDVDWDSYLRKMINEGEWGDHLILRAIVETIGHTIKVLNVSGDESHWTILEPATIDVSKDGMHLVLGHVGEFHYTSLRPADAGRRSFSQTPTSPSPPSPPSEDTGQIALEGTESIEMFREDYIDNLSGMPSVHFSYLLKRVIPIKVLDNAAVVLSRYTDNETRQSKLMFVEAGLELETKLEYGGRVFEGVHVPFLNEIINTDSSTDENFEYDIYDIIQDFDVVADKSDAVHESKKWVSVIDTSGVHVGYTKLLRYESDWHGEVSQYQPHIRVAFSESESTSALFINRFIAIQCQIWPDCAKSWVSRVRREGWPSKEIVASIESDGCLLLPNAHKESKIPNIEWQFCFALCEKKLFRDALSLYQKYGYILFSAFCTQTLRYCKEITSTHLKSVFFYACEKIPAEFWESCPGACVLYMLDELLRYVKTKYLPNYFVNTNNMIDYLTESNLKEIEEQIVLLRSQPILFLRQIDESLKTHPYGNALIDKVEDDFPRFKEHRSLKMSTLDVFIPATIDIAHYYIRHRNFEEGYDLLSQAFQERLSVSTCDDSVPFQLFLPSAVSGLDLHTLVWFSAYTDRQLEGQLSKSLIRETCGDLTLVKIKEFLPDSVVGSYGDTEVPFDFSKNLCSFCHDFAKFLFETNKLSEILPILYYCHDIFVNKSDEMSTVPVTERTNSRETFETNDFTDEAMFDIYTAMFTVYKKQHQVEFFRALMPVVKGIVGMIHSRGAYKCLCYMYKALGDAAQLHESASIYEQLPEDRLEQNRVAKFLYWPRNVYSVNVHQ